MGFTGCILPWYVKESGVVTTTRLTKRDAPGWQMPNHLHHDKQGNEGQEEDFPKTGHFTYLREGIIDKIWIYYSALIKYG